ncbi:MAG: deoxyribose-phosphate aldolase [Firmicutes bacterium]|nr:deoxyribose-phosphate aldolase [Bacillota bacterium]
MIQSKEELVKYIDHTLLKPEATVDQVVQLCREAAEHGFQAVCINPSFVELAVKELSGTEVVVATVIGFPLGATTSDTKLHEAVQAVEAGAGELDMVINIGRLKAGDHDYVAGEIRRIVKAVWNTPVKIIIETALLTQEEKITACQLAKEAGAAFVKTSTGFAKGGATVEDVRLMREVVGSQMGVKASGGIRDLETLEKMVEAGANRIGTSSGMKILAEFLSR